MAAWMNNLLPPNATLLERNLAAVNSGLGDLPVPLRDLVRPDACPSDLLPWLAQALSVDSWDMDWSETQKRDTIKASIGVHRVKGTVGAVRRALASIGIGAQLQEWFNQIPAGDPYTYRLLLELDQVGVDQVALAKMNRVVDATKNLRSHLDSIHIAATSRAETSRAIVTSFGYEVTVKYGGPSDLSLVMEGIANGDAPTEAAVDALHTLLNTTMPTNNYW
jgi:phage tail P2-like protein